MIVLATHSFYDRLQRKTTNYDPVKWLRIQRLRICHQIKLNDEAIIG